MRSTSSEQGGATSQAVLTPNDASETDNSTVSQNATLANSDAGMDDERRYVRQRVLDKELVFAYPKHYCPIGNSPREEILWAMQQPKGGQGQRLLLLGVACEELAAFRAGHRNDLDHWFKLEVMETLAQTLTNMPLTRDEFLSKASKAPAMNGQELNQRLLMLLKSPAGESMQVQYVGRSHEALYYLLKVMYSPKGHSESNFKLSALGGITLVKNLPLTLTAYAREEANSEQNRLLDTVDTVLHDTIEMNERSLALYLETN